MRKFVAAALVVVIVGCSEGGDPSSSDLPAGDRGVTVSPTSDTSAPDPSAVATSAPNSATEPPPSAAPPAPTGTDAPSTTLAPTTSDLPIARPAPTAAARFFVDDAGQPFFWLGDTAWTLPYKLDRDEVGLYLDTRASQGFNVVQMIAIVDLAGWPGPNRYGDQPFVGDVSQLSMTDGFDPADADQYDYWDHLDFIVAEAAARNMTVALLPFWANSELLGLAITTDNAAGYGAFLAARYGGQPVFWVLGGDAPADGKEDLWREVARGLSTGATGTADYAATTMTYHPGGFQSSAQWFHNEPWLDFNMIQGGHCLTYETRQHLISTTYQQSPPKPFLDAEPLYEAHPYCLDQPPEGFSTDRDIRREAYYSVFAGAAGHTYGHNAVYQFLRAGDLPRTEASGEWTTALHAPGGEQMGHLKALMLSRPFTTGVPDDAIILAGQGAGGFRLVGTRAEDGSYMMVYSPIGTPYEVDLDVLAGDIARLWWFNPRTGEATLLTETPSTATIVVTAPEADDWVLVVDDAARSFVAPGT